MGPVKLLTANRGSNFGWDLFIAVPVHRGEFRVGNEPSHKVQKMPTQLDCDLSLLKTHSVSSRSMSSALTRLRFLPD